MMLELFFSVVLAGADKPKLPCDLPCEKANTVLRLEQGENRSAIDGLKEARRRFPDDRALVLLLARAYVLDDNLFWAERTLQEAVRRWPDDPELRSWIALVHLRQGDPELAKVDLDLSLAPNLDPEQARWQLLDIARARQMGEEVDGSPTLARMARDGEVYPEDHRFWAFLSSVSDPWWVRSFDFSLDLGIGHTSNALAGSPTDPGTSGGPSGLGRLELRGRFAPPTGGAVRPAFDLEILGNGLADREYSDLSSIQGGVRAGLLIPAGGHRFAFGYRFERLYLNQEPALYSEANRVEAEVEWVGGRVLFAGGGRRIYEDERRTRWEGDLGYGGSVKLFPGTPLLAGMTLRLADAESPAYDQIGISGVLSASFPLARKGVFRTSLSLVWDDYPHSGGEEGWIVFGTEEKRRDVLARVAAAVLGPTTHNLRPGLELRYTRRDSTADERPGFDFSFTEWRVVAWLRWTFGGEPWGPRRAAKDDHVPLDWGLESQSGIDDERILDLLRRDEELRRGSSCGIMQ